MTANHKHLRCKRHGFVYTGFVSSNDVNEAAPYHAGARKFAP